MKRFEELIREFKNVECTFLEMENAFSSKTGHDVLNTISINNLLENKSVSFKLDTDDNIDEYLNVEFEIIKKEENLLETLIKVTGIDIV